MFSKINHLDLLSGASVIDFSINNVNSAIHDYCFSTLYIHLIPSRFALHQNYPNPFNSSTIIKYDLKNDAQVAIKIYDILGRKVRTLINDFQNAGYRSVIWDGKDDKGILVATGLYFYKINAGNFIEVKKLVILK